MPDPVEEEKVVDPEEEKVVDPVVPEEKPSKKAKTKAANYGILIIFACLVIMLILVAVFGTLYWKKRKEKQVNKLLTNQ